MNKKRDAGGLPFMGDIAGTVSDSYEMLRKFWSASGLAALPMPPGMAQFATALPQALPSMVVPTLDVQELDKRITDLRAVEQWLELNAGMLRATIQSLEVQRNTIATLKSFGGAMMNLSTPAANSASTYSARTVPPPSAPRPTLSPLIAKPPAPQVSPTPAPKQRRRPKKNANAAVSPITLNPAAWWDALQEQFTKVAATAAATAATETKATVAKKPAKGAKRSAPMQIGKA